MHISKVRIRNFRNFVKGELSFQPGVNTLIGENGSGKTNAFQALRLLLDENLSRNALYLRETDFCRAIENWRGHWIIISAEFVDLDYSDGCQVLRHTAGHMNETNSGTFTLYFRPKKEVRKKLFELSESDEIGTYLNSLTVDHYEPVLHGRATGDFLDDSVYREVAGNPEEGYFPDPDDEDSHVVGVRASPIYQEIACTFVRALRDVVSELKSYRGNPLLTLLRGMESDISIEDAESIVTKVEELNANISDLKEIKDLATGIEGALSKAVGHTYGSEVTIESSLPTSLERILQRLNVLVGEQNSSYQGEVQEQSLGSANLIYLALKLLEYELKRSSDRVAHFLLIEEPEAHIHTHIQKTLFSNLPSDKTQVFVSSHSTHISSASRIKSVNVLAKNHDHAEVFNPSNGLGDDKIARVERYLDAIRSTILFAKGVLLVEGDAEQLMIPAMLKAIFGVTPDQLGFSVISMNCAFFEHISVIFAEERVRRPCAIVTDLDASIFELPDDAENDTDEQSGARASEKSGFERKLALDEYVKDNLWIEAFYADHTFEVDFVSAGNEFEVSETLPLIYQRERNITKSKGLLEQDDISVYGKEVLRLANKEGKGWFALLLADNLSAFTYFPPYILKAVAFASHRSVSVQTLHQIALYRLKENDELAPNLKQNEDYASMAPEALLEAFFEEETDDDLTAFKNYIGDYNDLE